MKKRYFIVLVLVVIGLVFTSLWKLFPTTKVDWFVWSDYEQSIQWYIFDTTEMLRASFLYLGLALLVFDKVAKKILYTTFAYSLIRILDYYLYNNSNDLLLTIILLIDIITYFLYTEWKRQLK